MPYFTSQDGVRLHYDIEGAGPPLLLHLGAGGDSNLWREAGYVEPLSKSYACILFDHRGHGKSDHPSSVEANHIDRYSDDVVALIEHLGHESVSFFGWSNAVTVGLKAAQEFPDVFDAMVMFGAMGRRATPQEIAKSIASRVPVIREKGWWSILEPMREAEKFPVPEWFFERVVATDVEPWIAYTEAREEWNWSPWDAMPLVSAPTLLLAGELEDPEDILAEAAAAMPNATRIRIPEREHINAFLDSDFVVPRVLDFLETTTPQATG